MQPPDRYSDPSQPPLAVRDALRALPLEQPADGGWQRLQQSLATAGEHVAATGISGRARGRRRLRWLAAAAVVILAIATPSLWNPPPTPTSSAPTLVATTPGSHAMTPAATDIGSARQLSRLQRESAELEALLSVTRDDTVISSTGDVVRDALTERVQWVDAMISDPQTSPATQLPLWQERVLLLRRLATVDGGERLMAVNGEAESSRMVMAF